MLQLCLYKYKGYILMDVLQIDLPEPSLRSVLDLLLERYKITESELARAINLPRATINRLTTGKIKDPKSSTLFLIANYFDVSMDQLLGHKPIYIASEETQTRFVKIPLLNWSDVAQKTPLITAWVNYETQNLTKSNLVALKVKGDAMWPNIGEDSTIIVDLELEAHNRSIVVAHISSTDEVVLRQLFLDGKTKILKPMNNLFNPIYMDTNDCIIGVVIQLQKNFN